MASSKSISNCFLYTKPLVQKVIIPKGAINPEDTVVIEIPSGMRNVPILLAQRQPGTLEEILNNKWNMTRPKLFESNDIENEKSDQCDCSQERQSLEVWQQTSVTEVNSSTQCPSIVTSLKKEDKSSYSALPDVNEHKKDTIAYSVHQISNIHGGDHIAALRSTEELRRENYSTKELIDVDLEEEVYYCGKKLPRYHSSIFRDIDLPIHNWAKHDCKVEQEFQKTNNNVSESNTNHEDYVF